MIRNSFGTAAVRHVSNTTPQNHEADAKEMPTQIRQDDVPWTPTFDMFNDHDDVFQQQEWPVPEDLFPSPVDCELGRLDTLNWSSPSELESSMETVPTVPDTRHSVACQANMIREYGTPQEKSNRDEAHNFALKMLWDGVRSADLESIRGTLDYFRNSCFGGPAGTLILAKNAKGASPLSYAFTTGDTALISALLEYAGEQGDMFLHQIDNQKSVFSDMFNRGARYEVIGVGHYYIKLAQQKPDRLASICKAQIESPEVVASILTALKVAAGIVDKSIIRSYFEAALRDVPQTTGWLALSQASKQEMLICGIKYPR
jgi:hypothetical protein